MTVLLFLLQDALSCVGRKFNWGMLELARLLAQSTAILPRVRNGAVPFKCAAVNVLLGSLPDAYKLTLQV